MSRSPKRSENPWSRPRWRRLTASVTISSPPPRLPERVRERIPAQHDPIRTEQAYVDRIERCIRFYGKRHPAEPEAAEVGCSRSGLRLCAKGGDALAAPARIAG
jgi:hypothetical protein